MLLRTVVYVTNTACAGHMPHAAGALNGAWSELRLQEVALVPLLVRLGGAVQEVGRSAEEDELGRLARSLDRLLARGVAVNNRRAVRRRGRVEPRAAVAAAHA